MADAGYLTTLRGQRSVYLYYRDNADIDVASPDYVFNSETSSLDGTDDLAGLIQATLNNYFNADNYAYSTNCLTYNPITDRWDLKPGSYVL